MNTAEDSARINRERQREEHLALAKKLGIEIPVMPPRYPGETDKDYGVRIAWIAKSFCGPPPRLKTPPKRMPRPSTGKADKADNSTYRPPPEPAERLAGMAPDLTTEDG